MNRHLLHVKWSNFLTIQYFWIDWLDTKKLPFNFHFGPFSTVGLKAEKAVSAYFPSKHWLPFGFTDQYYGLLELDVKHSQDLRSWTRVAKIIDYF